MQPLKCNDNVAWTLQSEDAADIFQQQVAHFVRDRFGQMNAALEEIGFPARLVQAYKVVRTATSIPLDEQEVGCSEDASEYRTSTMKRKLEKQNDAEHGASGSCCSGASVQDISQPWLISTSAGLLETGCLMRFGRQCTCEDDCMCEGCPKHRKVENGDGLMVLQNRSEDTWATSSGQEARAAEGKDWLVELADIFDDKFLETLDCSGVGSVEQTSGSGC
jgi:hypothetical protein